MDTPFPNDTSSLFLVGSWERASEIKVWYLQCAKCQIRMSTSVVARVQVFLFPIDMSWNQYNMLTSWKAWNPDPFKYRFSNRGTQKDSMRIPSCQVNTNVQLSITISLETYKYYRSVSLCWRMTNCIWFLPKTVLNKFLPLFLYFKTFQYIPAICFSISFENLDLTWTPFCCIVYEYRAFKPFNRFLSFSERLF